MENYNDASQPIDQHELLGVRSISRFDARSYPWNREPTEEEAAASAAFNQYAIDSAKEILDAQLSANASNVDACKLTQDEYEQSGLLQARDKWNNVHA